MIADFEDFVTWMFVTIDDLWQKIAPMYDRPGPDPTSCSDSGNRSGRADGRSSGLPEIA